jgi:hypothetical protein
MARDANDFRAEPSGPLSSIASLGSYRALQRGTATQITRVQFQVSVETCLGDHVRVVGSCPQLGCWQPDKSQLLTTDPSMYPMWTGSVEMNSSEPFEYKYVIQRAAHAHAHQERHGEQHPAPNTRSEYEWETDIANRGAIPEGVFIVLEDGKFNVERATVFDRKHQKVDLAHHKRYNAFLERPVSERGEARCLYIISFKLPIMTSRGPSGEYMFEWHPGSHSTTSSRHAGYVVEKLRKLRRRAQVCRNIPCLPIHILNPKPQTLTLNAKSRRCGTLAGSASRFQRRTRSLYETSCAPRCAASRCFSASTARPSLRRSASRSSARCSTFRCRSAPKPLVC